MGFDGTFAACSDIKIFYGISGSGPRLLYISGTGGDLRRPQNALTSSFPDHFETLSYDQRGLAQTDKPDALYSMAQYCEDAANLLDVVGWDSCFVMGISFGGMVAQELAIRHPGRVKKLVLGCTSTGGAGGSSYPLHELQDMPLEEKIKFRMSKNDTRLNEQWQQDNPEKFQELFDKALETANFAKDDPGKAMGSRRQLEARAEHDTFDRVVDLTMPVLVCGGRYDGQAEPQVVENLAKRIPGAELAYFEGGHFFLAQDLAASQKITEFLLSE
ncbi:MAG: alpha/beta hydrolase [Rhodospirillales bacterium]|jgi:3-oxoadipate enol-lactonase